MWTTRICLASVFLALFVWRLEKVVTLVRNLPSSTESIIYNDVIQKALELRIGQSGLWAQATFILIGTLGALWIAKGDKLQLSLSWSLWPEIGLCVAGLGMLVLGLYCYKDYVDGLTEAYRAGGVSPEGGIISIPDVFAWKYDALRIEQFHLLLFGAVASVLAVFSLRNLANRGRGERCGEIACASWLCFL